MSINKIAVIGGTGLNFLDAENSINAGLQWQQSVQVNTLLGEPSAPLQVGTWHGKEFVFLARHGNPSSIAPHKINYRANLLALQQQEVEAIIAVNAVGGITAKARTGGLLVTDQIIDYTWGREHSFLDGEFQPLDFVDFTHPYDQDLRAALLQAASESGIEAIDGGVYGATQGPRLETPAEILRMERDGCDVVGMTGMPEAGLARELGIPYASIAVVANPAAGKSTELITMDEIQRVLSSAMQEAQRLIAATVRAL